MMASTSEKQKRPDDVRSTFDADIQALNHAKDSCGIPPAQDAFDSSSALLTALRVQLLLFHRDWFQSHVYAGLDGQ